MLRLRREQPMALRTCGAPTRQHRLARQRPARHHSGWFQGCGRRCGGQGGFEAGEWGALRAAERAYLWRVPEGATQLLAFLKSRRRLPAASSSQGCVPSTSTAIVFTMRSCGRRSCAAASPADVSRFPAEQQREIVRETNQKVRPWFS